IPLRVLKPTHQPFMLPFSIPWRRLWFTDTEELALQTIQCFGGLVIGFPELATIMGYVIIFTNYLLIFAQPCFNFGRVIGEIASSARDTQKDQHRKQASKRSHCPLLLVSAVGVKSAEMVTRTGICCQAEFGERGTRAEDDFNVSSYHCTDFCGNG